MYIYIYINIYICGGGFARRSCLPGPSTEASRKTLNTTITITITGGVTTITYYYYYYTPSTTSTTITYILLLLKVHPHKARATYPAKSQCYTIKTTIL